MHLVADQTASQRFSFLLSLQANLTTFKLSLEKSHILAENQD
jgi:hypothetical protein